MINRLYIKKCLSFEELNLEFSEGLNVFTGPSGAGKSVLMQAILSLFSRYEIKSQIAEIELYNVGVEYDAYNLLKDEEIVIKAIKKEKARYFLNNQTISKKNLNELSLKLIKHLNLKDVSDFETHKLLRFLDNLSTKNDKRFKVLKNNFDDDFKRYIKIKKRFEKLIDDEKKIEELKEFIRFEINKIESINPNEHEYEDLNSIKKRLTKKEKIQEAINSASPILNYSNSVSSALDLLEVDSTFFDDAINELNNIFEKFNDSLDELENVDIENVLDRIEKLSSLQKKFGSITKALEYKENKKKELEIYENISFEKNKLEKEITKLQKNLIDFAQEISSHRKKSSKILEEKINYYLNFLYLSDAKIEFQTTQLNFSGIDEIVFNLKGVDLDNISSGEFNRLRLALLTAMSEYEIDVNGILFLDEIDANLSGKESEAIARVLKILSNSYQIFAISHQPQLTSNANSHFLVDKIDDISKVKKLNEKEKINEIARMISGEEINSHAVEFAKNVFKYKLD